ncbi:MAG TPA: cobalamin biosynthesis protein CobD [bacterium]|nr:cobalamin biosynthesis protein CobD [bacterium]HEX68428.1 cobalamin biosynthesis protein CobD [bacterium]
MMEKEILAGGFLLDLLLGDPLNFPHPVRWIGKFISWGEKQWYTRKYGGYILLSATLLIVGGILGISTLLLKKIHEGVEKIFEIILFYFALSYKSLMTEAKKVETALKKGDIHLARKRLKSLVSRDTASLNSEEIVRATVESLAENLNDGVIAPCFYFLLGGVTGMWLYKAVNTLDSMVGYKNEKYLQFGKPSAYFDDILNFIPARLTALLLSFSFITPPRIWKSLTTFFKEGKNHPSPNAGYPEASMAGGLGVQLGGPNLYSGKVEFRPYLGEAKRRLTPEIIWEARVRCGLSILIFLVVMYLINKAG